MNSDGKKELWDFLPLRGDPTPEERAQLLEEAKADQAVTDDAYARSVLAEFKTRGLV